MLKVLIATDFKMICKGDNIFLKDTTYNTIKRYKETFGYVILCTRNYPNDSTEGYVLANDIIDETVKISNLHNTLLGKHDNTIEDAVNQTDLVIARVPSIIAYKTAEIAKKSSKPLFSVAIGCAWDAYWNHRFPGKIIAPYMFYKMKKCMKESDYALYVTEEFLQKRYPCTCKSIGVSDVVISIDQNIINNRIAKIDKMPLNAVTLMTSGSVGNKAKGQQYMIKAIPLLNKMGIKVNYLLAGGDSPVHLVRLAEKLNVVDQVTFLGMLSTDEVLQNLDEADIYVQPSLQEGLPRAVVEAMSRGCPVVGANTGGIPELISGECIVPRKSPKALSNTIMYLLKENRIKNESISNYQKSKSYDESLLREKREKYYSYIISDLEK